MSNRYRIPLSLLAAFLLLPAGSAMAQPIKPDSILAPRSFKSAAEAAPAGISAPRDSLGAAKADSAPPAAGEAIEQAGDSARKGTAHGPARMTLNDGSELVGTVQSEGPDTVVFRTAGGLELSMPRSQIRSITLLPGKFEGERYLRPDPNYTRLLFAPTARPLKSGQGYFSAYEVFFPFLAVGVGDILTLAGGISLIPFSDVQMVYLAPKVTALNTGNFSLAGGVLYLNLTSHNEDFDGAGILYTVSTYGTSEAAVTGGLGWGFYGDEVADDPVLMLGGELRVSNSVKFVSENWFPPESDAAFVSLGIRFFGDKLAADLALIHPVGVDTEGFPFMPWLGFAYNFGVAEQKGGR